MNFRFTSQPIDKVDTELLLLMFYEGQVPLHDLLGLVDWRVNGRLSELIQQKFFLGKAKEMLMLPAEHRFRADKLVVLGLGQENHFEEGHIAQVFDFIVQTVSKMRAAQVCLSLSRLLPTQFEWRNAIRLFVSKLFDYPHIQDIIFCEPDEIVQEAKRRQLDLGHRIQVSFD